MRHRVAVIGSLLIGLASFAFAQFDVNQTHPFENPGMSRAGGLAERGFASISGIVHTPQNHGVPNARIEVHDGKGTIVASTYSGPNGAFQLANLRPGRYEVVAISGLAEAREQLILDRSDNSVSLQISGNNGASDAGTADSVSVADMQVPEKARKALNKARELLAKHRTNDAQKQLARALEIYPHYSEALRERGILSFVNGQVEQAQNDLGQAIKYDPNNGMAYIALAAIFNNQDKFDDAARALDRGVALMPNVWQGYFELARMDLGKGNFADALRNSTKAQELSDTDYAPLHLVRAHALIGVKNYVEAETELEAYLQREPADQYTAQVRQTLSQVKAFTARAANGK
jgi:tetratricopeptide (TPR) repeat protein